MKQKTIAGLFPNFLPLSQLYPCIFSAPVYKQDLDVKRSINLVRYATILSRTKIQNGIGKILSLEDSIKLFKVLEGTNAKFTNTYFKNSPIPIFSALELSYVLKEVHTRHVKVLDEQNTCIMQNPYLRREEFGLLHLSSIYLSPTNHLYIDPSDFVYCRTGSSKISWIDSELLQTSRIVGDIQIVDGVETIYYYRIPLIDELVLIRKNDNGRYILVDCPPNLPIDILATDKPSKSRRLNIDLEYFDCEEVNELLKLKKQKNDAVKVQQYDLAGEYRDSERKKFVSMEKSPEQRVCDYHKVVSKIGTLRYSLEGNKGYNTTRNIYFGFFGIKYYKKSPRISRTQNLVNFLNCSTNLSPAKDVIMFGQINIKIFVQELLMKEIQIIFMTYLIVTSG